MGLPLGIFLSSWLWDRFKRKSPRLGAGWVGGATEAGNPAFRELLV
jgi:hypothetical protein